MSCECTSNDRFSKGGTIVLTKNDINKIRNNKVLDFHFHGLQFQYRRITFFVSNKKNVVEKDSKLGINAGTIGEVCPIIVDEEQMSVLKKGERCLERILPCVPPFQIIVCTSSQWHKQSMEQNG